MLTQHLDTPVLAQQAQHLLQDRPGQCQALRQPRQIQRAGLVQVLAQKIGEQLIAQAGLGDIARLRGQVLHGLAFARVGVAVADGMHDGLPR